MADRAKQNEKALRSTEPWASFQHQGPRPYQEDRYAGPLEVRDGIWVAVLADGMGGYSYGDIAAEAAITGFLSYCQDHFREISIDELRRAVLFAHRKLKEVVNGTVAGTTLVGVVADCRRARDGVIRLGVAWVGDSRCYLLTRQKGIFTDAAVKTSKSVPLLTAELPGGQVWALTADHSSIWTYFENGHLAYDDLAMHPYKHELERALLAKGKLNADDIDVVVCDINTTDAVLVLCSDGVWEALRDHLQLLELYLRGEANLSSFVRSVSRIVALSQKQGEGDNATLLALDLGKLAHAKMARGSRKSIEAGAIQRLQAKARRRSGWRTFKASLLGVLIGSVLTGVAFWLWPGVGTYLRGQKARLASDDAVRDGSSYARGDVNTRRPSADGTRLSTVGAPGHTENSTADKNSLKKANGSTKVREQAATSAATTDTQAQADTATTPSSHEREAAPVTTGEKRGNATGGSSEEHGDRHSADEVTISIVVDKACPNWQILTYNGEKTTKEIPETQLVKVSPGGVFEFIPSTERPCLPDKLCDWRSDDGRFHCHASQSDERIYIRPRPLFVMFRRHAPPEVCSAMEPCQCEDEESGRYSPAYVLEYAEGFSTVVGYAYDDENQAIWRILPNASVSDNQCAWRPTRVREYQDIELKAVVFGTTKQRVPLVIGKDRDGLLRAMFVESGQSLPIRSDKKFEDIAYVGKGVWYGLRVHASDGKCTLEVYNLAAENDRDGRPLLVEQVLHEVETDCGSNWRLASAPDGKRIIAIDENGHWVILVTGRDQIQVYKEQLSSSDAEVDDIGDVIAGAHGFLAFVKEQPLLGSERTFVWVWYYSDLEHPQQITLSAHNRTIVKALGGGTGWMAMMAIVDESERTRVCYTWTSAKGDWYWQCP